MKKLQTVLMFVLAIAIATPCAYAQSARQIRKTAKKDAKVLRKEGWKTVPGDPSMTAQLEESYRLQNQKDKEGYGKYLDGRAMTTAGSFDAAILQAENLAKLQIAGKMETRMAAIINTKVANEQLGEKDAATLVKTVATSKNLIAQRLGQVITPVKIYRELPNGNTEVTFVTYYSQEMAAKIAKKAMKESLEKDADKLADEIDKLFGL